MQKPPNCGSALLCFCQLKTGHIVSPAHAGNSPYFWMHTLGKKPYVPRRMWQHSQCAIRRGGASLVNMAHLVQSRTADRKQASSMHGHCNTKHTARRISKCTKITYAAAGHLLGDALRLTVMYFVMQSNPVADLRCCAAANFTLSCN